MADGAAITSGSGAIRMTAAGDVTLSRVGTSVGDIEIVGGGSILDGTALEGVNVSTSGTLWLRAASGIGAFGKGDLNLAVGRINAVNRTAGNIVIADEDDLRIGDFGLLSLARNGWVVVYTKAGKLGPYGAVRLPFGAPVSGSPQRVGNVDFQPIMLLEAMSGLEQYDLWTILSSIRAVSARLDVTVASPRLGPSTMAAGPDDTASRLQLLIEQMAAEPLSRSTGPWPIGTVQAETRGIGDFRRAMETMRGADSLIVQDVSEGGIIGGPLSVTLPPVPPAARPAPQPPSQPPAPQGEETRTKAAPPAEPVAPAEQNQGQPSDQAPAEPAQADPAQAAPADDSAPEAQPEGAGGGEPPAAPPSGQ